MDVRPSMLRGYQPRRVVREGERERPGEVYSQTDQRIVDEGGSTKWPSSTTHSSPALNPGEVNYTDQRKQVLLSAGCFCLSALEESTTRLDLVCAKMVIKDGDPRRECPGVVLASVKAL